MLKAGEIFFLFSGKFSVFVTLSERRKIRKKIRKFGPITMCIAVFCFLFSATLKPLQKEVQKFKNLKARNYCMLKDN